MNCKQLISVRFVADMSVLRPDTCSAGTCPVVFVQLILSTLNIVYLSILFIFKDVDQMQEPPPLEPLAGQISQLQHHSDYQDNCIDSLNGDAQALREITFQRTGDEIFFSRKRHPYVNIYNIVIYLVSHTQYVSCFP